MMLLPIHAADVGHIAESAAAALVAGVWQGVALAAVTALLLRVGPKTTATVRFIIWACVFTVSASMPLVHVFTTAAPSGLDSVARFQVDVRWSYLLAGIWAGASLVRLAMLAGEVYGLRTLWKSAVPVEREEFVELLAGRRVQVCTTGEVDRPSVIGFFAPRILIPDWLFAQLSEVELRHIVLHEMEHLRRRDDWINLLQKIALVLFPLNPAIFWIDRRLSTEREIACDDGVLERTKTPRAYAASLTSIAEQRLGLLRLNRRMVALALGAIGAGGLLRRRPELTRRIESILAHRNAVSPAVSGGLAAVLVLGILGAAVGMMRAPELVGFGGADRTSIANLAAVAGASQPDSMRKSVPQGVYRNASFRVPAKAVRVKHARVVGALPVEAKAVSQMQGVGVKTPETAMRQRRLMVLTTWQAPTGQSNDIPVSRVVVRMPDGRFLVTPYAAVPTQAGWLIVQL